MRQKDRATQTAEVLWWLQHVGSLTSWDAIEHFHATRLADIVYRLKKQGHNIVTVNEEHEDENGEVRRHARYYYVGRVPTR